MEVVLCVVCYIASVVFTSVWVLNVCNGGCMAYCELYCSGDFHFCMVLNVCNGGPGLSV